MSAFKKIISEILKVRKGLYELFPHFDWFEHLLLCYLVALADGPKSATYVGLTIEGVQIESGNWQKWDHLIDLCFDAAGIFSAIITKKILT